MVLDQVENFIRVSVAGGHASGDNTISLQSGEASFLPDVNQGKYNLTWWDSENFSLPSEDPNVEIVRVNSIDTTNDTISVTRGQENTSATSKSTGDGEYSLILSPTAKTIEDIDANKLDASAYSPEADTHTRYSDSEAVSAVGASTPFVNSDLSNSSVSIAGNSVSLGGSTTVNHADLSNIGSSDHHSRYSDSESVSAVESAGDISISGGLDINADNSPLRFGANQDFVFTYDSSTDELVLADSNGIELLRQPKAGPTQFIQGADVGPISAPEDSFAQLINAPVTSAAGSGDKVGYTLALDNQSILSIDGEADGSGGIQNTELVSGRTVNVSSNDIVDNGQTIWDTSSQEIPDSALGSITNNTLSNSSVSVAGNSVSLGGSTTVNHADLSNIGSSDHHSKTTSASELTDVSADSVSGAHHSRYSDSEAVTAVGASTPFANSDLSNSSVSVAGNSVSLGGSTTVNHADLSNIGSSDHHSRYSDSEAVSAVNSETSLSVDITGDAATVDGKNASDFVSVSGDTINGDINAQSNNILFQPASSGGTVTAVTFESNTNSGSDFGYIKYHDDYFGTGESGVLQLETQNDGSLSGSGPDAIALSGATGTFVDSGSLYLDGADLTATNGNSVTQTIWDDSAGYITQSSLENDSVIVAGNSVSLGGSTTVNHADLSNIGSSDHHSRYSDSEARSALDGSNPQFGSSIGFNNDSTVISHNDSNNESGSLYSGIDGVTFKGDGNVSGIALVSGYIRASEGLESDGDLTVAGTITENNSL